MNDATALLAQRLAQWTGLDLDRGTHGYVLRDTIARRATEIGTSVDRYASSICTPGDPEATRLIDLVTVCHSWFFRDLEQMHVVETLLAGGSSELDVWLAACATGDEAYSIAMLAESLARRPRILATDINTEALARARVARYGRWSLRELPARYREYLVARSDSNHEVDAGVRKRVELARHNLMDTPPPSHKAGGWDLILCRNVLMYFRAADATATIERLARVLRPGGHLILGANDILAVPPRGLRFVRIAGRYVLQRPLDGVPEVIPRAITQPMWAPPASATRASSQLPIVAERASTPVPSSPLPSDDALAAGTRQFEAGDFAAAITHYSSAMERDPLSPEAAALTGIACFLAGDAASALFNLRRALALDPELWQAELYLAMSHERLGSAAAASAAYHHLLAMLSRPQGRGEAPGVLSHLEVWRADALTLARHKTRAATRPR
ncbi:MAG TPA: CheR family methyltransferase [Kofleriaceae bacterium]|nr:CheR family methyltransferase [Kofleriaceae bacterium]